MAGLRSRTCGRDKAIPGVGRLEEEGFNEEAGFDEEGFKEEEGLVKEAGFDNNDKAVVLLISVVAVGSAVGGGRDG